MLPDWVLAITPSAKAVPSIAVSCSCPMAVRHSAWRFNATVEPPTLHQYKVPMPNPLDTPSFDLSPLYKPTSCMVPIGGGHNDQCSISHAHHLIPRFPRGFPTYAHLLHFLSDDLFIPKLTDGEFDSNTSSGRLGLSRGGCRRYLTTSSLVSLLWTYRTSLLPNFASTLKSWANTILLQGLYSLLSITW